MSATGSETEIDLVTWMASRLLIVDKRGQLVPYVPNDEQLRVYAQAARQQDAGVPVRLLVLKARQIGVSTAVEALIFALCATQAHRFAEVIAHDDDSATTLFEMAHRFETHLPADERRPLERSSRKEIAWAGEHASRMAVHTAGAPRQDEQSRTGRSRTIHYLHASEVPYWSDQAATLKALLQCVPYEPGTIVVLEFTANGAGGEAYERWQAAYQWQRDHPGDVSGYIPVFISWLSAPEYALPLAAGETIEPDQEEARLVRLGATPANLKWRRQILRDQFNGDEDAFRQEYPATPAEAFQVSGRPAIPARILRRHETTVRPPARYLALERGASGEVRARETTADAETAWHVWADPEPGEDYAVAGDVPEGAVSDPADPKSEPDWATGVVLRRRDLATVATFRAHIEPDFLGEQLVMIAERYNQAWATPEANAAGMAALAIFTRRSYPRLYRRKRGADTLAADAEAPLWGWKTTGGNRDLLIDTYIAYARPDPIGEWKERVQVLDPRILDEERTFVRKKSGKREHQAGTSDDLLFALFIALQVHLDCPRVREPARTLTVNPALRGIAYAGGLDTFDEDEDGAGEDQMR